MRCYLSLPSADRSRRMMGVCLSVTRMNAGGWMLDGNGMDGGADRRTDSRCQTLLSFGAWAASCGSPVQPAPADPSPLRSLSQSHSLTPFLPPSKRPWTTPSSPSQPALLLLSLARWPHSPNSRLCATLFFIHTCTATPLLSSLLRRPLHCSLPLLSSQLSLSRSPRPRR